MSRRSLITRADAIDRDQRRRTMGAVMWSEAPVAPTAADVWADGDAGGGGWDPGWPDIDPLTSSLAELWAEVSYTWSDPLVSTIADMWAEVGYGAGDPLMGSITAETLAEVAHTTIAGLRSQSELLAEVALAGTISIPAIGAGSHMGQVLAQVAITETGPRSATALVVEVAAWQS